MDNMTYLCIDLAELISVAKFFHLIDLDIKRLKRRKEKDQQYSLQFPNSVSLTDCQTFLDIISNSKPVMPKLLSVLHASVIFILADYFCVDLIFEELHACFSHNPTLSPLFMKLFLEYYSHTHPQTIDFYHAFTESFMIPRSKLKLQDIAYIGMKGIKKIARDHRRVTDYVKSLCFDHCYVCEQTGLAKTLTFSC